MKLNKFEFMLMNNPVRALIQERVEAKILRSMSSLPTIDRALEIGCGNGSGTRIIKKWFSPANMVGIDLDAKMIEIAQRRNRDQTVTYQVMDASSLDFQDGTFDAVFDFGMIHHIPNWQDCIQEIKRVLKPNGEVILEELSIDSFSQGLGRAGRYLLAHPYREMFSTRQFTNFMLETGFEIEQYRDLNPFGLIRLFSLTALIRK